MLLTDRGPQQTAEVAEQASMKDRQQACGGTHASYVAVTQERQLR